MSERTLRRHAHATGYETEVAGAGRRVVTVTRRCADRAEYAIVRAGWD